MNATMLPVPEGFARRLARELGSTRLTLVLLAIVAAVVVAHAQVEGGLAGALAAAFAFAATNLAAALLTNARLRADLALFVFHLALLALLALAALGRLTALTGTLELAQGEVFDGQLLAREAGPLHPDRLSRLRFVNDGFTIDYAEGWRRGRTANDVRSFGDDGRVSRHTIGDIDPLVLEGYRFYTTPNKGFAIVLRWVPRDGLPAERGTVHLPAYPMHEHRQAQSWRIPGTARDAWVMLDLDAPAIDPSRASSFQLPGAHRLVFVAGGERRELRPGDTVTVPEGVLVYEGLTAWMGYKVFYDPTLPWLLASAAVAILALSAFFWRRFGRAQGAG
jgi:cytochrome c biogenesis protein